MNSYREKTELHKQPRGGLRLPLLWGFIFSAVFLVSGTTITGIGLAFISYDQSKIHVPLWVVVMFGLIFVAAGYYLAAVTLLTVKRRALAKRVAPSLAWRYDFHWSRTGITDETVQTIGKTIFSLTVIGFFLIPFHAVFLFDSDSGTMDNVWVAYVVLGLFDALLIGGLIYVIYFVLRRLRFGKTKVLFGNFPFFIGENLDVSFEGSRKLANISQLDVTLRCVEEAFEARGSGRNRSMELVGYQIYHDQRKHATDTEGRASFSFPLPAEIPGTQLIESPPIYWELVVRAVLPGVDYEGVFLMPVYTSVPPMPA